MFRLRTNAKTWSITWDYVRNIMQAKRPATQDNYVFRRLYVYTQTVFKRDVFSVANHRWTLRFRYFTCCELLDNCLTYFTGRIRLLYNLTINIQNRGNMVIEYKKELQWCCWNIVYSLIGSDTILSIRYLLIRVDLYDACESSCRIELALVRRDLNKKIRNN